MGKWYYQIAVRSFVTVLSLALLFATPLGRAISRSPTLTACAAFALDGSSAAVTTDASRLSLEVTDPSGKTTRLSLALRRSGPAWRSEYQRYQSSLPYLRLLTALNSCQAAFNHSSGLVAVSVFRGASPDIQYGLQIGVADLRTSKWVGDFDVERQPAFVPLAMAGFLGESNSVVVTGALPGKNVIGVQQGSFASLLFDTSGRQVVSAPAVRTDLGPTDGTDGRFYADAAHDRLWSLPCVMYSTTPSKQPPCAILSTTLLGEESQRSEFNPDGYAKKRTELWMLPNAFAALDANTVLIGEGDTIWCVDGQKRTLQHLVLPKRRHFPDFENIDGPAVLSPDGELLAVPLEQGAVAFPYLVDNYVFKGADIAVVQLQPFQLLGIVPHERGVYHPGFAVNHRPGKATILVYRQDRWERREFSCPPNS